MQNLSRMRELCVAFFGIFCSLTASGAEFSNNCYKFSGSLPGGYCIHSPKANGSESVIYHLHGGGGSEFSWQNAWFYPEQIRKEWEKNGFPAPTIVSLSFGRLWLLSQKNSSPHSGLFETLLDHVIPEIEKKIGGVKGKRTVLGESMGGFNATQLALRTNLFSKAAILCAPMAEISPYASSEEIESFAKRSGAWQFYKNSDPDKVLKSVNKLVELVRYFFPTEEDWKSADPLVLAKQRKSNPPELYVAIGYYDQFAAYEGNEKFVELLKANGAKVNWRPQWGGHCAIDIPSLAEFLVD